MPTQGDLVREAIGNANRKFEATYRAGDPVAVARLYTAEAILFPTGAESVSGLDAIAAFWRGVMDLGIAAARLETLDVDSQGHTAIERGRYTLLGEGDYEVDRGKYVVVWKQVQGEWKLHWDIWNSSVPPRA